MIQLEHVSLTIKRSEILKDVSAAFARGGIHGLIGRNGSGKTMLMKCICGFIRPTGDEILVAGRQVGRDVDFPPALGLLIETPGFIPYDSGYHNLKLLSRLRDEGATILLVSHIEENIRLLCDTVWEMENGVLVKREG